MSYLSCQFHHRFSDCESCLLLFNASFFSWLVFLQSLRERKRASEQTDGKTAEKTTDKKVEEEDEDSPYNLCSPVDLDNVRMCVCVSVKDLVCDHMERVYSYMKYLFVCACAC